MNTRYAELIHKEIDGIITPAERKVLQEALKKDPDLQRLQTELKQTSDLLGTVPQVDPPPHLKERILGSIPFKRPMIESQVPSWMTRFWGSFSGTGLRPAYILITGIMAGIILTTLYFLTVTVPTDIPGSGVYGTIGLNDKTYTAREVLPVNVTGIQGQIAMNMNQDLVWVEIQLELNSQQICISTISRIGSSFHSVHPVEWGKLQLAQENNLLQFAWEQTSHFFIIFLKTSSELSPISIELYQAGKISWRKNFSGKNFKVADEN